MSAPQLAQIVFYLVYTSNVILLVQFTTPSGGKIPGISYQVRALLARGSLTPYYYWLLLVGRKLMVRGSSAAQPRFWPVLLVLAPSCGQDWVGCRRTPTISPCIIIGKVRRPCRNLSKLVQDEVVLVFDTRIYSGVRIHCSMARRWNVNVSLASGTSSYVAIPYSSWQYTRYRVEYTELVRTWCLEWYLKWK